MRLTNGRTITYALGLDVGDYRAFARSATAVDGGLQHVSRALSRAARVGRRVVQPSRREPRGVGASGGGSPAPGAAHDGRAGGRSAATLRRRARSRAGWGIIVERLTDQTLSVRRVATAGSYPACGRRNGRWYPPATHFASEMDCRIRVGFAPGNRVVASYDDRGDTRGVRGSARRSARAERSPTMSAPMRATSSTCASRSPRGTASCISSVVLPIRSSCVQCTSLERFPVGRWTGNAAVCARRAGQGERLFVLRRVCARRCGRNALLAR